MAGYGLRTRRCAKMLRFGGLAAALGLAICPVVGAQTVITPAPDPVVRFTDGGRSLLISQIGYALPGVRVAYLMAPTLASGEGIATYQIEDDAGLTIHTGTPLYAGTWKTAHFWRLDLEPIAVPGTYRLRAGTLVSHAFVVRSPRAMYFDPLARGFLIDQLRVRYRDDARGGFIDAGNDIRETNSHATQALGMLDAIERYGAWLSADELVEIDGYLRHFTAFLLSQQQASGRFLGGWGSPPLDGHWPNQLQAVYALSRLLRHYRTIDPAFAAAITSALRAGVLYTRATMVVADTHSAFLVERLLSDVAYHFVEGDAVALDDARRLARELRARQVRKVDVPAGALFGGFREQACCTSGLARLNHHDFGEMTGEYWGLPLWGLVDLMAAYPADPELALWRTLLEEFVNGFLRPMSEASPMGLVANGEYGGVRWFSDLFHGMSNTYALTARGLLLYGEALGDRSLYDLAEKQLLWIGGLNTGDGFPGASQPMSCIVGHGYRYLRDGHGVFTDIPGSIVSGFSATPQFVKEIPPEPAMPQFLCDESWLAHTGGYLSAMSDLLRARLDAGNTLRLTRTGSTINFWFDPVVAAREYRVYRADTATSRYTTLVVAGASPPLAATASGPALQFYRVAAADDATEGPR